MILKDVLSRRELEWVSRTLGRPMWGYGFISADPSKPIWNFDKISGREVAKLVFSKLSGFELLDWHINGQTFGLDAAPHRDNGAGATHSFVFFPMPWDYLYGGRLHVLDGDPQIITPEENTGVLIDASYLHYADGPSVHAKGYLRVSISLKLRKND